MITVIVANKHQRPTSSDRSISTLTLRILGGGGELLPETQNGAFGGEAYKLGFGLVQGQQKLSILSVDHFHFIPGVKSEKESIGAEGEHPTIRGRMAGKHPRLLQSGVVRRRRRKWSIR